MLSITCVMGGIAIFKYASEILCNCHSRDKEYCVKQEYNSNPSQALTLGDKGNTLKFASCSLHVKHISKKPRILELCQAFVCKSAIKSLLSNIWFLLFIYHLRYNNSANHTLVPLLVWERLLWDIYFGIINQKGRNSQKPGCTGQSSKGAREKAFI